MQVFGKADIETYRGEGHAEEKEYRLYDTPQQEDAFQHDSMKIGGGHVLDTKRFAEYGTPIFIAVRTTVPKESSCFSTPKPSSLVSDQLFDELFKRIQPTVHVKPVKTMKLKFKQKIQAKHSTKKRHGK